MASRRGSQAETIEPNVAAAETRGAAQDRRTSIGRASSLSGRFGNFFELDPTFLGIASVKPYERKRGDPLYRPLRIYTLDPNARRREGAVATVNIPFEPLEPGPKGALFEVVDRDVDTDLIVPGVNLDDKRVLITNGREPSLSDYSFHQQMVYAVSVSTYNVFRSALGRDPTWGFAAQPGEPGPVLRIHPHAFKGQNAYYDPDTGTLNFGYFDADAPRGRNLPHGRIFTCLSHDIVAHEMTHALLDGMRARFRIPTNPDVLAFHEGFADLVAIFLHFSYREVVQAAIERTAGCPETDSLLLSVAQQFGQTVTRDGHGAAGPLRSAIDVDGWGNEDASASPKRYDDLSTEPHELGSLLVSAVFEAFAVVFRRRTRAYHRLASRAVRSGPSPELAGILAEQASKLAAQFLSICIRAIDFCPPIDLRFGEYLRALITADFDLVPDDPFAYREALLDAFARRGIYPDDVINLSEDTLLWRPPPRGIEAIAALHFAELRFAGDPGRAAGQAELRRQAEAVGEYVMRPGYADLFGCALPGDPGLEGDRVDPARICSVRSLRRIGPDREVVFELVAEVVQRKWLTEPGGRRSEFYGGSTAIIGADGRIRYLIIKRITDRRRVERQAQHLAGSGSSYAWVEAGNRRYLPLTALRQLHECGSAKCQSAEAAVHRRLASSRGEWI
jgi:hypothetical protein